MKPSKLKYIIAKTLFYLLILFAISPILMLIGSEQTFLNDYFTEMGKVPLALLHGLVVLGIFIAVGALFILIFGLFSWITHTINTYEYYDDEEE